MNWDYLAGLFDGEGSLGLRRQRNSVLPYISFSVSSEEYQREIASFLKNEGITTYRSKQTNHLGKNGNVQIMSWKCAKIFTEKIAEKLIQKKPLILLLNEALEYHSDPTREYRFPDESYLRIRNAMHSYAKKGPKTLKPWIRITDKHA